MQQIVTQDEVFVLMKDDFVRIDELIRRSQHDVIHVGPGQKITAHIVADLAFIAWLERAEGVIGLEDHHCGGKRGCDLHFRKYQRQGFAKHFQLDGNLPNVTLAGVANQREILRLHPRPVVFGARLIATESDQSGK